MRISSYFLSRLFRKNVWHMIALRNELVRIPLVFHSVINRLVTVGGGDLSEIGYK